MVASVPNSLLCTKGTNFQPQDSKNHRSEHSRESRHRQPECKQKWTGTDFMSRVEGYGSSERTIFQTFSTKEWAIVDCNVCKTSYRISSQKQETRWPYRIVDWRTLSSINHARDSSRMILFSFSWFFNSQKCQPLTRAILQLICI